MPDKNKPKEVYWDDSMKWRTISKENLILSGDVFFHLKGCLDDWAIPFVIDSKKTYVIIEPGDRYQKTWVSQPTSGWMMNFGGRDGSQPNIAKTF